MRINFLILILLAFCLSASGQDLATPYAELLQRYKLHRGDDLTPVKKPALDFLEKAKEAGDSFYLTKTYFLLGYIFAHTDEYGRAVIYYLEGLRQGELSGDPKLKSDLLSINKNISTIMIEYHHYDLSKRFLKQALAIAHEINKPEEIVELTLHNYANCLIEEEKYDEALSLVDSVTNLYAIGQEEEVTYYNVKGVIYRKLNNDEEALENYNKAQTLDPKSNYFSYFWSVVNAAGIYAERQQYDEALRRYDKAQQIINQMYKWQPRYQLDLDKRLAELYMHMNNRPKALAYYNAALGTISQTELSPEYFEVYEALSTFYMQNGDYEKALEYKNHYSQNLETYLEQQKEIEELDKRHNIELLTERYFDLVEARKEKQNFILTTQIGGGGILLLLISVIAYLFYQKTHTRRAIRDELVKIQSISEV